MVAAAEFEVDPELSRWIAIVKSGRYTIHRPLLVGATLAGRPELERAFEEYGDALGEAFQLRDDLIDAFGDSSATGKPTGLDVEQHKMTLLMGLAMDRDRRTREIVLGAGHDPAELRAAGQVRHGGMLRLAVLGREDADELNDRRRSLHLRPAAQMHLAHDRAAQFMLAQHSSPLRNRARFLDRMPVHRNMPKSTTAGTLPAAASWPKVQWRG